MREPPLASSSSRDEEVTAPKRKLIDGDEVIDSPTRTKARRVVEESSDSEDGAVAARAQAAAMAFAAGPAWEEQAGPAAAPLRAWACETPRRGCAAAAPAAAADGAAADAAARVPARQAVLARERRRELQLRRRWRRDRGRRRGGGRAARRARVAAQKAAEAALRPRGRRASSCSRSGTLTKASAGPNGALRGDLAAGRRARQAPRFGGVGRARARAPLGARLAAAAAVAARRRRTRRRARLRRRRAAIPADHAYAQHQTRQLGVLDGRRHGARHVGQICVKFHPRTRNPSTSAGSRDLAAIEFHYEDIRRIEVRDQPACSGCAAAGVRRQGRRRDLLAVRLVPAGDLVALDDVRRQPPRVQQQPQLPAQEHP